MRTLNSIIKENWPYDRPWTDKKVKDLIKRIAKQYAEDAIEQIHEDADEYMYPEVDKDRRIKVYGNWLKMHELLK